MLGVYEECRRRKVPLAGRNRFFTHVNCVTPETIRAMVLLDPTHVQIGIESGDDGMLRAMRKGFTAEAALRSVRLLDENGLRVKPLFLLGFPGETARSLENTLGLARAMRPFTRRPWVSFYQPVPGTIGHELALKHGRMVSLENRNDRIAYIDNNLTAEMLARCRNAILGGAR
jgi:radical SAM superfamily enzyme YgiQ (UPF0313 family)